MMKSAKWIAACAAAFLWAPAQTLGQQYPTKPVRIIMPNPPGGASDVLARMLQPKVAGAFGQPVIVENRSGVNVGVVAVAKADPDGHTLLFSHVAQVIGAQFAQKNPPYDPVRDFAPTMVAVESYTLIVGKASVPGNSFAEVLEHARRNPGKLSIGSSGVGTYFHLMGETLKHDAGVDMLHVPYKGAVAVVNALLSGQIDLSFVGAGTAKAASTKLKVLAVGESTRNPSLPTVPSINDAVPGFRKLPSWFGFFAPAGVAAPIVARAQTELARALASPDVSAWIEKNDLIPIGATPQQSAAMVRTAIELYGAATKVAGVKPE